MDILTLEPSFEYHVQIFSRGTWKDKIIHLLKFIIMPVNDHERSTMTVFLTLISVALTAVIIGFGAVLFKLLNALAI